MRLKEIVKAHGWTMEMLAKEMGVSQPAVSKILNGNPTLSNLKRVASAMKISVSELVADDNDRASITCPYCGRRINLNAVKDE